MARRRAHIVLAALIWSGAPGEARAGGAEDAAAVECERVRADLADAARVARIWTWGWGVGWVPAIAVPITLAQLSDDEAARGAYYISAGRTTLAAAAFFLLPLHTAREHDALEARIRRDGRCDLAAAERHLAAAALVEARGRAWTKHAAVVVVNVAAGLAVGLAYDRWVTASIVTGTGLLGGELQIWTQPTRSIRALERHRERVRIAPFAVTADGVMPGLTLAGAL